MWVLLFNDIDYFYAPYGLRGSPRMDSRGGWRSGALPYGPSSTTEAGEIGEPWSLRPRILQNILSFQKDCVLILFQLFSQSYFLWLAPRTF